MKRTWTAAAVAAGVLLLAYLLATDPVWRQSAWLALVAGATGSVYAGIRLHRPPTRRPYVLLLGALVLLTAVNVIEFPAWHASDSVLTVATALELLAFPTMGLATLDLVRLQTPHGDREGVIDGTIVMVALATLLSGTVSAAALVEHTSILSYALLAVAPIVLAGVATAAMRLLLVGNQRLPATWLIAGAPLLALGGHVLRTLSQSAGTYARGGWEDLPIGLSYGLVGLAVLHPTMVALAGPAPTRPHRLTHGRVAILGLALLAAPATMVMTGRTVLPFIAAVVLSLLVLVRLWSLVIERETGRDEMRRQAAHDPLTGLPNRTSLLERLDDVLARRSSADPADAVLFLDLDGFKRVNDAWGHAAGDQLLVAVADPLPAGAPPAGRPPRAPRRRRVRPGVRAHRSARRRPARGAADRGAERALRPGGGTGPGGGEHRADAAHRRRRGGGGAAGRGRRRDVPGEAAGRLRLRDLRRHARGASAAAPAAGGGPRRRAADRRPAPGVPARRRARAPGHGRLRGAPALGPPGPRGHLPRRGGERRRGHRHRRCAGRVGAARGLRAAGPLERLRARARPAHHVRQRLGA